MKHDSVLSHQPAPSREASRRPAEGVPGPAGQGRGHGQGRGRGRREFRRRIGSAAAALHNIGAVTTALLCLVAIGAMIHEPVLIPSLAASAAVLHSTPTLPMAQPRSVIVGHLLGAAAGYLVLALSHSSPWTAALAGGATLAATTLARTPHSPAVATSVIVVLQTPAPARFVPLLLGATTVLTLAGVAASRVRRGAPRYPVSWW